ncbi:hypothetical protein KC19_9G162900 [Ceratodon purpureus]|uniref:Uncharacterized protein n=1 Tax=Ceratodon purpureus TaxID=3225 RepID=A0A8T0GUH4_CERPU|nr:hypothetical protein KC19_9G162900 [Ceratodon purpureus]
MEIMHRSLSAQLRAVPSHGSFRKLKEMDSWDEAQEEDDAEDSWVVKSLPERWRIVQKLDTASPYYKQKVVIDLGMTTSYRKEGANYIIRAEIFDLLWDSNMFSNENDCRGWFIDSLEIQFQPMWNQDEIITGALYPKTTNTAAYFGNSTQAGISGFISRNPTIAVTMSNTRSQQTSQQMYKCNWERGSDGLVSLNWKLNLWCPSSNLEYPKLYNPRSWSGSKVPMLPPDYEKGNFSGLDYKPRVEWVVPATVVRARRASWRVTVSANLSCVSSKKSWLFATDKFLAQRQLRHEEVWRFPAKASGQMEDWHCASSRCRSARHSLSRSL